MKVSFLLDKITLLKIKNIFTIIKNNEILNKKNKKNQFIGLIWGIFNC